MGIDVVMAPAFLNQAPFPILVSQLAKSSRRDSGCSSYFKREVQIHYFDISYTFFALNSLIVRLQLGEADHASLVAVL
jgi:hypothetical protein